MVLQPSFINRGISRDCAYVFTSRNMLGWVWGMANLGPNSPVQSWGVGCKAVCSEPDTCMQIKAIFNRMVASDGWGSRQGSKTLFRDFKHFTDTSNAWFQPRKVDTHLSDYLTPLSFKAALRATKAKPTSQFCRLFLRKIHQRTCCRERYCGRWHDPHSSIPGKGSPLACSWVA